MHTDFLQNMAEFGGNLGGCIPLHKWPKA